MPIVDFDLRRRSFGNWKLEIGNSLPLNMDQTSNILAAFITPSLAAIGVGAMSVPIIIHLLARRRFKRIRWAAMEFLLDAERRNRRRVRMEEWILLALRCLAVALLGLMVARPFVSPGALASAWGGSKRTERILVIDDSFSMSYTQADDSPFARSKAALRRLVDSIRMETPDDAVTLVRTSNPANPVSLGTYLDTEQAGELLARIEAMTPSQRSMDLAAVIKGVADLLERDAGIVDASVYFVGDFQRVDWGPKEGATSARTDLSLLEPLRAWQDKKRSLRAFLVNVGEDEAVNDAVLDFRMEGGRPVAGTSGMVRAELAHYGPNSIGPVSVDVQVGQRAQPPKSVESLGAYQQAVVEIESNFLRVGDESLRVEMPRDALPLDNVRYASVDVVSAIRVLIVNGEPSADEYEDEVSLLRTALRPEGEVFSGHEVTVIEESALEGTALSAYHAVILANVYRLSEPAIELVERFARSGGGVMIFLGDQVDATSYKDFLYRDGAGLLPVAPTEVMHPAEPVRLVIADRLHPALGALGGGEDPLGLGQIPFFEYFATLAGQPDAAADADKAGKPESAEDQPNLPRVIARFNDADQSPAIVERAFGLGRVMLFTTSADKEWNLWADHPTYLPVLTELLRHLTAGGTRASFRVGQPIQMDIEAGVYEPTVAVRTPGYPDEPEATTSIVPVPESERLQIRWEQSFSAGIYQFALRRLDGTESVRFVAVNVDPRESNLAMVSEDDIRQLMEGIPYYYVKGLDRMSTVASEARTELWTPVLLFAALVLMSEQFLAFWWGRRR